MNRLKAMLPVFLIASIVLSASAIGSMIYTTINFGPTTVTNPPLGEFHPMFTTTYNKNSIVVNTLYAFSVTLSNPNDVLPSPGPVVVKFTIVRANVIPQILATDVTLEYQVDATTWAEIPMIVVGNSLVGYFGPSTGFTVTTGYLQTTNLRVTYHALGTYSGVADLVPVA